MGQSGPAESLRDYLLRRHKLEKRFKIVLAERANQLFRDTHYHDLITFEEDIAKLASLILLIAESPGSLAELGAFASSDSIRPSLRVIMQEQYFEDESFIRFGPIERLRRLRTKDVGVFPWKARKSGTLDVASATPHADAMISFIDDHIRLSPASNLFSKLDEAKSFFVIYWVAYLAFAVPITTLYEWVKSLLPTLAYETFRNQVYCLQIVGWLARTSYSGKDYFYCRASQDPFDYRYKSGVTQKDSLRRKTEVIRALQALETPDPHVKQVAANARGGA